MIVRTLLASAILALGMGGAAGAADAPAREIPETVDINVQKSHPERADLPADTKAVKGFSHRRHAEEYLPGRAGLGPFPYNEGFTCAACHHTARTPEEAGSCWSCKDVDRMLEAVGGPRRFKGIYHGTCRACHRAMEKAGEASGPTRCRGCHG